MSIDTAGSTHAKQPDFGDRVRIHLNEGLNQHKNVLVISGPTAIGAFRASYQGDRDFMKNVVLLLIEQLKTQAPELLKEIQQSVRESSGIFLRG